MTNSDISFEKIDISQSEEFKIRISEDLVNDFAKISGDFNPLHLDSNFALKTQFGKKIVHGMLLASFFSQLIGMKLPGKNGAYFSQTLNFKKPCYVGNTVRIVGTVVDKSYSTKIITLKTEIFDEQNQLILDGEARVLFYK